MNEYLRIMAAGLICWLGIAVACQEARAQDVFAIASPTQATIWSKANVTTVQILPVGGESLESLTLQFGFWGRFGGGAGGDPNGNPPGATGYGYGHKPFNVNLLDPELSIDLIDCMPHVGRPGGCWWRIWVSGTFATPKTDFFEAMEVTFEYYGDDVDIQFPDDRFVSLFYEWVSGIDQLFYFKTDSDFLIGNMEITQVQWCPDTVVGNVNQWWLTSVDERDSDPITGESSTEDACYERNLLTDPPPNSHGCGLGWELALLLPWLMRRRR